MDRVRVRSRALWLSWRWLIIGLLAPWPAVAFAEPPPERYPVAKKEALIKAQSLYAESLNDLAWWYQNKGDYQTHGQGSTVHVRT